MRRPMNVLTLHYLLSSFSQERGYYNPCSFSADRNKTRELGVRRKQRHPTTGYRLSTRQQKKSVGI